MVFLNEIFMKNIPEQDLKVFLKKIVEDQINGINNIKSKFPIFKQKINGKPLVYLDSANSAQKPKTVIDEISRFYKTEFSNVGRSVHTLAVKATNRFEQTRDIVKSYINQNIEKK